MHWYATMTEWNAHLHKIDSENLEIRVCSIKYYIKKYH